MNFFLGKAKNHVKQVYKLFSETEEIISHFGIPINIF